VRRSVHQLAAWNHGCRLGEPGGKPVGSDFAFGLITGPGSSVKSIEGRRAKE
jgi:hypothetical protein